jgi:hypothetical protein
MVFPAFSLSHETTEKSLNIKTVHACRNLLFSTLNIANLFKIVANFVCFLSMLIDYVSPEHKSVPHRENHFNY